ncbi:flagellar hook-basal body protein [Tissierella sp. MSJ-40]|uniref:Flagellar hook-basal body protein n=1 Tax=Tissierella simiarum TaxID=2841534 RepID=A0ABS6E1D8_9FIRM|nr:flagellar hook-basal body protein [Tissierella simiarum]MBU5436715.1 flagellar hook-basal body protein [Tissierella simiarum]
MNRGLYIGATSLVSNQRKLEVLSNNLANVNTAGFKKDISLVESFPEKLLAKMSRIPEGGNLGEESNITYERQGEVHTARTEKGYFVVNTPMGKSYVKDIRFIVDENGYLRTYYKNVNDEYKTDYENYITDASGNPIQGDQGDMENFLQGIVYNPPAYVVGTMSGGIKFQKNVTDFTQGNMMETGGALDLGLKGQGFFKVVGENGQTQYTRDGSFTISDGYLTTLEGNRVLGMNGEIYLTGKDIDITNKGQVIADGNLVDTINLVDINNKEFLRKIGNNLYTMAEEVNAEEIPFEGEVLQGYLETSNVNAITGMVEMITLLRDFEASQKVIRIQDEMLEKAANEIGRV